MRKEKHYFGDRRHAHRVSTPGAMNRIVNRKGVYLKVVDFDAMFNALSHPAIIVNDFDISSESERARLNSLIYTRYDGDTLSNIPSCDCGRLTGERNKGRICGGPKGCGQLVVPVTEKKLESLLWMEAPDGIPAFVNLKIWRILSKHLTVSSFNFLEWLTNPFYRPPVAVPQAQMAKIERLNLPMGLSNFCRYYDQIIDSLYTNRIFTGRVQQRDKLYRFLKKFRDRTFTKRLPFPSRLGFITEESNGKVYADHKMASALDAIWTIVSMYANGEDPSLKMKESRCVRAMNKLNEYYKDFEVNTASRKEGIKRKLIYGTRPHWTYRAVISSLHRPHNYDELELPWSLSTMLYKIHLANKLLAREFTPNEIIALLYENSLRYHPLLDSLFKELIAETPGGLGLPSTLGRNPTLRRGSIQTFKITKIKDDPSVNTISLSVLCLRAPNADFDGDALNGQPCLDNDIAEKMKRLEPHLGAMDLNKPWRVSRNLGMPTPVLSTIGAWIDEGDYVSQPREV